MEKLVIKYVWLSLFIVILAIIAIGCSKKEESRIEDNDKMLFFAKPFKASVTIKEGDSLMTLRISKNGERIYTVNALLDSISVSYHINNGTIETVVNGLHKEEGVVFLPDNSIIKLIVDILDQANTTTYTTERENPLEYKGHINGDVVIVEVLEDVVKKVTIKDKLELNFESFEYIEL